MQQALRCRASARRRMSAALRGVTTVLLGIAAAACGSSSDSSPNDPTTFELETTRLCALVPARDAALGSQFPQPPPVQVFGTDLGWTYERDGVTTILFGDSWQRIDICPIQINDDTLATLHIPDEDWPGFTAEASIPDAQCPQLTYPVDAAGTSFAPLELTRWDGAPIPLGPLNTPVTGFFDGQREWGVFIIGGGQRCTAEEAAAGAPCPTVLSAQAADLICQQVGSQPSCVDPTSIRQGGATQAYYLHFAERVGTTQYVSRAAFLTNKYLNLTARAVRAFDPADPRRNDYRPGTNTLLVWGRPGFDDQYDQGEAPPYFMYLPLPFEVVGDRIAFAPRYLSGVVDGVPAFSDDQADATPLYTGEFEPVNHAAVSYIEPLRRWLMIYGGNSTDYLNVDGTAGQSQPVPGAMHARFAPQPWGPWTDPEPVLTNDQIAQDLVCGKQAPPGCIPQPDPIIRPACIESFDPQAGGNMYGANIIDVMTRRRAGGAVDIFWNVSNWHPYTVVLVKTRIEPR